MDDYGFGDTSLVDVKATDGRMIPLVRRRGSLITGFVVDFDIGHTFDLISQWFGSGGKNSCRDREFPERPRGRRVGRKVVCWRVTREARHGDNASRALNKWYSRLDVRMSGGRIDQQTIRVCSR